MSAADGVVWDLKDLYSSPADPRIETDADEAERRAAKASSRRSSARWP